MVIMGVLKDKQVYLSGPIQYATEQAWNHDIKQYLKDTLGLSVLDPATDPKQQWKKELEIAQQNKDFETMRKIARSFVREDLGRVDRADFIIANLPYKVATTGTIEEIIRSNDSKKPTLLVCDKGREWIPMWFYGYIPLRYMFDNRIQLLTYLHEVDNGKHIDDDRWHFIYN